MIFLKDKGPLTFLISYLKFLQELAIHPYLTWEVGSDYLYTGEVVNKIVMIQK